jgi:membrane-associated phospholipid phosphatase
VLFALSAVATIHLGWHYVVDDVAGLVIAVAALALAAVLTGFQRRRVPDTGIATHPGASVTSQRRPRMSHVVRD